MMPIEEEDICMYNNRKGKCTVMMTAKNFPNITPGKDEYTDCDGVLEGCPQYDTVD